MKRILLVVCGAGMLLGAAELTAVHSVYVMPMAHGMDQYLASRLTTEGVFRVVTDPKLADAVFTDRIGEGFETRFETLFPKPAPAEPEPVAKKADKVEKEEEDTNEETPAHSMPLSETVNKLENPALNSSWGRGKGTLFLVDAKSREVVWSAYVPPRSGTPQDLDRTASDIVKGLKKQMTPKK